MDSASRMKRHKTYIIIYSVQNMYKTLTTLMSFEKVTAGRLDFAHDEEWNDFFNVYKAFF